MPLGHNACKDLDSLLVRPADLFNVVVCVRVADEVASVEEDASLEQLLPQECAGHPRGMAPVSMRRKDRCYAAEPLAWPLVAHLARARYDALRPGEKLGSARTLCARWRERAARLTRARVSHLARHGL